MFSELNNFVGEYKNLLDLSNIVFPCLLTIFMAMIAYEQYKINLHFEYCRIMEDLNKNLLKDLEKSLNKFFEIIMSKDENLNKQDCFIKELDNLEVICKNYEHIIEYSDSQLLNEAYKNLKKWIKETKNYNWTIKNILHSFNVIINFLSFLLYAESCYITVPNKHVTLYSMIGFLLYKIYTFFIPYFVQKKIKKFLYPKFFKMKIILFGTSLIWKFIKTFKDDENNECKIAKIIEVKNAE